jgi:hypothetical protein
MANLAPFKFEKIGDFMRALCKDRKRCEKMAKDADFATKEFSTVLKLPPGHKVVVHLDEENVTHVIIPLKKEIEAAEASFTFDTPEHRVYPKEYKMSPLSAISETEQPMRAFSFILGEYTMRRCKN